MTGKIEIHLDDINSCDALTLSNKMLGEGISNDQITRKIAKYNNWGSA